MAFNLHTRFSSNRAAPKACNGVESKGNTMYFVQIGAKEKLKKREIEEKLGLSPFNRLHFWRCDSAKAYKTTFAYLMHNHCLISILEIYLINDNMLESIKSELLQFILSQSCSKLIKFALRGCDGSVFALDDLFSTLVQSNSALQCLQIENMEINTKIKLDKTLSKFIFNASVLRTLDLRCLRFSAKQNYDLTMALTECVWNNINDTTAKDKNKKGSHNCAISELFFGGNDNWSQKGIRLMCDFIKCNHNLEILGIELLNGAKDIPFVSNTDATAVGVFVQSLEDHPSLQRLEIYHIQTYALKVLGQQFEKRLGNNSNSSRIRFTELHIQQVHQNTFAGPMDHSVFPAIIQITQKIEWLQLLELKISVFCNLFEIKELCKLLSNCKHLNGLTFWCKMGEMFSKKQISLCVQHLVSTFKEMKDKNLKQGRVEIMDAIEQNLIIANDGNQNVDKDIVIVVLSYADISYAFDAGLLFFESTFLNRLDFKDRIAANQFLLNNWKKLPDNGKNMKDERYKSARNKLLKFEKKMKKSQSKKELKLDD